MVIYPIVGEIFHKKVNIWWCKQTTKVIGISCLGTTDICTNLKVIHLIVGDTFHKMCYRKRHKVTKIYKLHPLGTTNVCTELH